MTNTNSNTEAAVSSNMSKTKMFKPIKVGKVELSNRLAYAPTTRFRCTADGVPTDSMLEYYRRRAHNNGGLLTVEASAPHPSMGLYPHSPVLYTKEQTVAFQKLVEAVHKEGSYIGIQFWDLGRVADPVALKKAGYPLKGPSAIYDTEASEKAAKEAGNEIKAMTKEDIKKIVQYYAEGAKRAVDECGFDFVEIHGAHGYLLDSFLQDSANHRTDNYGGSLENKARIVLEVVDACIKAVGAEKVAIRLSPYAVFQGSLGLDAKIHPIVTWGYIISELQRRADEGQRLAYISVVEPRISGDSENLAAENIDISWIQLIWKGVVLTSGNYLDKKHIHKLASVVERDDRTIVGASRYFTSNPDLPDRLKNGYPLTPYNRPTFYLSFSNRGYLNFKNYGENLDDSKNNVEPVVLA